MRKMFSLVLLSLTAFFSFAQEGGGIPSRPRFQQVTVAAATGNANYLVFSGSFFPAYFRSQSNFGQASVGMCQNAACTTGSFFLFATRSASNQPLVTTLASQDTTGAGDVRVNVGINNISINEFRAQKTSATARASTTTLADDPDLTVTLPSGQTFDITVGLYFCATTGGAGGFKWALPFAGTDVRPTGQVWEYGHSYVVGAETALVSTLATSFPHSFAAISACNTMDMYLTKIILQTSTGGIFNVQWAQNSSNANAANLMAGSYIIAKRTFP